MSDLTPDQRLEIGVDVCHRITALVIQMRNDWVAAGGCAKDFITAAPWGVIRAAAIHTSSTDRMMGYDHAERLKQHTHAFGFLYKTASSDLKNGVDPNG